jgi:hypothetical protein
MACNCRAEITETLLERWKLKTPFAKNHRIRLKAYESHDVHSKITTEDRGMIVYCATSETVNRQDEKVILRKNHRIKFRYCPFCGVKYDPD